MKYDLMFGNCISGNVYVSEQGLYYIVSVTCSLPKEGIYKAVAVTDRGRISIGILTPCNDSLTVEKRISKKELGESFMMFEAVNTTENTYSEIPLNPETHFAYLEKMDVAHLVFIEGMPVIRF